MKQCVAILVCVFIETLLFSQEIKFKHLSSEDGLPTNTINTIFQDSEDLIWIGTSYGVCRFDGYNFLTLQYSIYDSLSLSNNAVQCIIEDDQRNIWIGTIDGLNRFNRNNLRIERVAEFNGFSIRTMLRMPDNMLLLGTNEHGLILFNPYNGKQKRMMHSSDASSISSNVINSLVNDPGRGIIVGTQNGLDVFDPQTETFDHILPQVEVMNICFYNDSSLFISVYEPGYYYQWKNKSPERIVLHGSHANNRVLSMVDTEESNWLGFQSEGVCYYDKIKNEQYPIVYNKYNPDGISSNALTCFYNDKWGNIWIGTFDGGLNFIDKRAKKFIHIKDNFLPDGLRNNRVRSIYQDSDGDIWVGTKVNGTLSRFDRKTLKFQHYLTSESVPESDNYIMCITEDKPGQLWVGTLDGMYFFNKHTGAYKTIKSSTGPNSMRSNQICALLKDADLLYIGHQNEGLDIFDTKNQRFNNFIPTQQQSSISDKRVRVLYMDSRHDLWVGTMNGLNKFDPATGTFQRYLKRKNDSTSISENDVLCIYEDPQKNFWIGTKYGLNLMNRDDGTFKFYSIKDGLPDNSVYAIYSDDVGNLWLSTHTGISRFNPSTKEIHNYNTYDGISANELSQFVHCKTMDGEILFGSNNGLTIFKPNQITNNDIKPKVVLTNFKLANKEVKINEAGSPLKKHISQCEDITLNYKQTFVSIEYAAINYSSTENNKYAYMLEGFEDDWNYVGTKREVSYTNLSRGNYVFKVKACNNDGVWNHEGVALKIKVLPPPWLSWGAYSAYAILSVLLLVWYRRNSRIKIEKEKELELNEEKLRFFINISHEFRTPLSLILAPLEKLKTTNESSERNYAIDIINRSTLRLLKLVNQLLDYRKAEMGMLALHPQETDIVNFTKEVFNLYGEVAYSKGITLDFRCREKSLPVMLDRNKYENILHNLLSNAIKFTDKGEVTVSIATTIKHPTNKIFAWFKKKQTVSFVEVKVSDTGIGLSKNELKNVFDRFYQVNDTNAGTGLGLNYVKSLVELHNGELSVESEKDVGTAFILRLPLERDKSHINHLDSHGKGFEKYQFSMNDIESLAHEIGSDNEPKAEKDQSVLSGNENRNRKKLPVVLVVEDNNELRTQIHKGLKGSFKILEAKNGQEAWDKLLRYYPDLVVSDVIMPVMDGIELCKKIKGNIEVNHIPVVLLTAKTLTQNKIDGYNIGADDYISKPFQMNLLLARIKNIIAGRKKMKERFSSTRIIVPAKELTTNNLDEAFLDKISKIVLDNMTNPEFNQNELAEKIGISRSNLFKKIQALTGSNPSKFIRDTKLKHAASLLITDNYSIKEICFATGFKSQSYFSKTFRELFEVSPQVYIDMNRRHSKKQL